MKIHPTAVVDPTAEIADDSEIGPYCLVGAHVKIGSGSTMRAHVVIEPYVTIGTGCEVFPGAVIGGIPQDRKFKGEKTFLVIGNNNIIREHVTIHRAAGAGNTTLIGDDNQIMAYSHIGHNCVIGSGLTMANMVGIAGHVVAEDKVVIGGFVGIHQFVRIGRLAMVGGYSKVVQDIPPYMMADGRPCKVLDLNVIGLRRSDVSPRARSDLRQAYKLLYRSNLNMSQAVEEIDNDIEPGPERDYLLDFIRKIRFGSNGRQNDGSRA
jgi:UDP-N-acetylglucosamine acyltransferase